MCKRMRESRINEEQRLALVRLRIAIVLGSMISGGAAGLVAGGRIFELWVSEGSRSLTMGTSQAIGVILGLVLGLTVRPPSLVRRTGLALTALMLLVVVSLGALLCSVLTEYWRYPGLTIVLAATLLGAFVMLLIAGIAVLAGARWQGGILDAAIGMLGTTAVVSIIVGQASFAICAV